MEASANRTDGEYIRTPLQLLECTQFELSWATDINRSKLNVPENGHEGLQPDEQHRIEEAVRLCNEQRSPQIDAMPMAVGGVERNARKEQER
jgi:hypothetical protein